MKEKIMHYRYWLISVFLIVTLIAFFCLRFILASNRMPEATSEEWLTSSTISEDNLLTASSEEALKSMYVDVKGAIMKPGIYPVEAEMRVWDVLELAGGVTELADENKINFSQKVEDQMVIYVPEIGEETDAVPVEQFSEKGVDSGKINLNTATEQELMTLSGIGQKKAQEIISYREVHGKFTAVEDLALISGFGEKTVEKLREFICVS
ncbi:helix-hairpin-helix domain-containing protein [Candidatus Enterococcus clewellii]|uniref:Competence protein ComEA n=1 Tax=Candidatus Enterococcus clewellii TaxID=1834193 RepID=A0A242KDC4_9ENTE|nr:helix-hairpin-helix domain-containing protein [Enterococcus sp. 9E7_DIV0242]OTP18788.1 hypothetical protein A5888_000602 [Enterococcus sp. 9E7_DIV0242]